MSNAPRPNIYLRAARGGRACVDAQERRVRAMLDEAGVVHADFHVCADIDTPGHGMGASLEMLVSEAHHTDVGAVIVEDLARLGRQTDVMEDLVKVLEFCGVDVVALAGISGSELRERLEQAQRKASREPQAVASHRESSEGTP